MIEDGAELAGAFDCPRPACGFASPLAASFCSRCGAALDAPAPKIGRVGASEFVAAGAIGGAADPWAWITDGRLLYLLCEGERRSVIIRAFIEGAEAYRSSSAVAASAVRGVAATRRGAFIVNHDGLRALFAPTEMGGAWNERSFELGGDAVGLSGRGSSLDVLVHDGARLQLKRISGSSGLQTIASAPWPGAVAPGWLQLYLHPRKPLAWIWGGGVRGRIDLPMGEMVLVQDEDVPAALPVCLSARGELGLMTTQRPHPAPARMAAVPASQTSWGVLDLDTGAFARSDGDPAGPLAIMPVESGVLAASRDALFHLEPSGGGMKARRLPMQAMEFAALTALSDGAVIMAQTTGGEIIVMDVAVDPGQPPALRAKQNLPLREGAYVYPALPPQVLGGEVWLAAAVGEQLALWRRPAGTL